jgi:hypothetical protein
MKDQILKIAGVKSEKEFYKKYPTEEAFMKAHKKEFKKAAMGKSMVNTQLHQLSDFGNPPIADAGATTPPEFRFTKFGATANNPQGSFGGGAATVGLSALQNIDKIIGGIGAISEQKKNIKKADQAAQLSGLALEANQTMEQPENEYVRPEDNVIQPGQMGNPYGSGTNYLAEDGAMISGNPTEIQNTYAPTNDIYDDLGFEPLEETYKQFRHGGHMHKAEFGEYFQDSGQAQIGSAVGESIGSAFGPAGAAVGKLLGTVGGNLLGGAKDARALQAQKDKMNMSQNQLAFQQSRSQGPLNAYMKDGGWVSHDWQPQVIETFGEHKLKDLLRPPHDADMLRAGGHLKEYTPPSERAMFTGRPDMPYAQNGVQMAMGGELEVGDGGYLETMSYNPNIPGGEIGMFRGASHDNGGIKTKYGENEVEVEGGEPAVKLQDGGSSDNLVVFGNMKINKEVADLMGDPKAKGMKFKTYVADIAKNDAKQLKRISKGLKLIENSDENNAFDHLSLNTGNAMLKGAQAWQKINADKIKEAGIVQDAIHQTAKNLGVKNDKLAEGKFEIETDPSMVAKFGTKMKKAQDGTSLKSFLKTPFAERKKLAKELGYADYTGKDAAQQQKLYDLFKNKASSKPSSPGNDLAPHNLIIPQGDDDLFNVTVEGTRKKDTFHPPSIEDFPGDFFSRKKGSKLSDALKKTGKFLGDYAPGILSNIEPFLRPTNADEPIPPDQLYPEFFALATNQLEPVQAQTFQPMLDSPVDISFNDQLAAVDAQSRAAIRAAGSNPAAQAMIMAQTLQSRNQILGERDRINTANKIQVYDKNRATLNDAQLRNLQILDKQYERQAEAASNTDERAFSALSSIASKTAQQRAINRKLAVMENLYNFRFDPKGRAINANALQFFNTSGNPFSRGQNSGQLEEGYEDLFNAAGRRVSTRPIPGRSKSAANPSLDELDTFMGTQKNGGKTKARNSSIVKALKNL